MIRELVEFFLILNITQHSVLKAVYKFINSTLSYSILNWGRASIATIQTLINLQNKAMKLMRPTKQTSLEESFQHLTFYAFPNFIPYQ